MVLEWPSSKWITITVDRFLHTHTLHIQYIECKRFFRIIVFMKEMYSREWRQKFIDVFMTKNAQLNLSAIRDAEGIFVKHICDSLELTKITEIQWLIEWKNIIDVGTWWWIPLLPLATIYPTAHFTWLDSVRKKTEAVTDMAQQLWLSNVSMVWSRAEEYTKEYDIMTARAMAFSDSLFKWTYHLVKKWWLFILYKMFSEEEETRLDSYVMQRKMTMLHKHYYKLFDDDIQRVIYVIKKG